MIHMLDAMILAFFCIIAGFYLSSKLLWSAGKALYHELKSTTMSFPKLILWVVMILLTLPLVFWGLKNFVWETIRMYWPSEVTGFTWIDTLKVTLEHLVVLSLPFLLEILIRFFWKKVSRKP